MRHLKFLTKFLLIVFIVPALASAGWWALKERPRSWREADWTSSGMLPSARDSQPAAIYVMAARTGGMKGAFSVHSWIVIKSKGGNYRRFDKVGWGMPVRENHRLADARWYSNEPYIVASVHGEEAEQLIPKVEAAIRSYPFSKRGDYHIWPGPNSNSFTAHVVAAVPELGATLPPNAVGKDYRPGIFDFGLLPASDGIYASFGGVAGLAAGWRDGVQLQFLGLVAGADFADPALLVPGFGRLDLDQFSAFASEAIED